MGWVTKKKNEPPPSLILNRYIQAEILPTWAASGREFKELAEKAGVAQSAISKCNSDGTGLGLDPIVGIAVAVGVRDFRKFWADAYAWFEKTPGVAAAIAATSTLCRDLPGWSAAAATAATEKPELAVHIASAANLPIPPEWRPKRVTPRFVLRMARILREREEHNARDRRDSKTFPVAGR